LLFEVSTASSRKPASTFWHDALARCSMRKRSGRDQYLPGIAANAFDLQQDVGQNNDADTERAEDVVNSGHKRGTIPSGDEIHRRPVIIE